MRLLLWFRDKRALARHCDDAHRALRLAHSNVQALEQRVVDLEVDLADAHATSSCAGRVEHIRLAHRLQIAETRAAEGLDKVAWLPVPLHTATPRGETS